MTIISDSSEAVAESVAQSLAYDRVQKARDDAQLLLDRTSFLQVSGLGPPNSFNFHKAVHSAPFKLDSRSAR